jgi:flagellar hook-length control protein FliK
LLVRSGEQELRLKLQPEFLGEILIKMRRIKGLLSAEIVTQSLALKELLEGNLENLRQRFQELNLSLEDLNISLGGKNGGGSGSGANKSPHFALPFKARDGKAEEKNIYFSGIEPEGKVNCLV